MEEKIALLFITQNIAPFRMMWLSELAKDMQINVFHLNDYHETVNKKYLEYNSDNISVSDKSVKILKWKFFKISSILRQPHDVLLLDGYGFIGQVFLIAILRLLNKKYLMTLDGGFIPEHENFFKRKIKKFCMDGVDAFFSTSKFTDEYIQHYVGTKKTIYRHYFSSVLSRDICSVEERLTLHDKYREKTGFGNKIIVIAVGRFIPIKGFDILLKAAKHVQTDVGFVFVGGKPGEDYLELIDDSNREKITFIDFLSAEELKKYYYAADLFVCLPEEMSGVWWLQKQWHVALPVIASAKCSGC